MSKKYMIILAVQFIVMAMLLVYAYYNHMRFDDVRNEAAANAVIAQTQGQEVLELEEELAAVKKQLEECQAQTLPK
jgi:hypothetical protein